MAFFETDPSRSSESSVIPASIQKYASSGRDRRKRIFRLAPRCYGCRMARTVCLCPAARIFLEDPDDVFWRCHLSMESSPVNYQLACGLGMKDGGCSAPSESSPSCWVIQCAVQGFFSCVTIIKMAIPKYTIGLLSVVDV